MIEKIIEYSARNKFVVLLIVAFLYLLLTLPLMRFTDWLERRLNPTRRGIHV